ncbi:hypothetical protein LTS18_012318, partial [Coniosporium uncinatum]
MATTHKQLDPSTLRTFTNAAAGHEGVLSDPTGALVIKPCTPAEIAFYESLPTHHPSLIPYVPTYMGTLSLAADQAISSDAATVEAVSSVDGGALSAAPNGTGGGTAATMGVADVGPMHGKKLDTEQCIVLSNAAANFTKPNILDCKLGARLWDDAAPAAKRARLDKVSRETTSGSLGFRIAGMRVWKGTSGNAADSVAHERKDGKELEVEEFTEFDKETGYTNYNKLYGRQFSAEDVSKGFKAFLPSANTPSGSKRALALAKRFEREAADIQAVLEAAECRMVSA